MNNSLKLLRSQPGTLVALFYEDEKRAIILELIGFDQNGEPKLKYVWKDNAIGRASKHVWKESVIRISPHISTSCLIGILVGKQVTDYLVIIVAINHNKLHCSDWDIRLAGMSLIEISEKHSDNYFSIIVKVGEGFWAHKSYSENPENDLQFEDINDLLKFILDFH
jgi:hypothetical protein